MGPRRWSPVALTPSQDAYPLNPLDGACGWRVLFQKIWLAGASSAAEAALLLLPGVCSPLLPC